MLQKQINRWKVKLESVRREFRGFERVRFAVLKEFPLTETGLEKVHRSALRKLIL
jgi:hypothetical protein